MQLERIAVRLRRRGNWEALDLGVVMWRAWLAPVCRLWLPLYWGFGALLLALGHAYVDIVLAVMWWLKPAFDRVLLYIYSRALFGTPTGWRDLRGAWRSIFLKNGLFWALTVGRLSLRRSFLLPVRQLEGLHGKEARARHRVLGKRTDGAPAWLTFFCFHAAAILWFGLISLIWLLVPEGVSQPSLQDLNDFWGGLPLAASALLVDALIEPLYVACGLALYVNRRSELEGWDIELAFRRLQARLSAGSRGAGTAATVALLLSLLVGGALQAPPAQAAETPRTPRTHSAEPARQAIDRILADPVFGKRETEYQWQRVQPDETEESDLGTFLGRLAKRLRSVGEFLAESLRAIVWIALAALVLFLARLLFLRRDDWLPVRREAPRRLFGLDVRPESLPEDIVGTARALFAAGRIDAGLALLYRAALSHLVHQRHIDFHPGDTEGDCQRRVRGLLPAPSEAFFGELLAARLSATYAHRQPPGELLERLCAEWAGHFPRQEGQA